MDEQEKITLSIDIDGVVATIREDLDYALAEPIPGAREALQQFKAEGYFLILHTARHINKLRATQDWLRRHEIPFDHLVMGKPTARYYIDDRALRFEGDWPAMVARVRR